MKRRFWLAWITGLLGGGTAWSQETQDGPPYPPTEKPIQVPPLAAPSQVSSAIATINQPKFAPPGRKNLGFVLWLSWADSNQVEVAAEDFGTFWRLNLPILATQELELEVRYAYLLDVPQSMLADAVQVYEQVVEAIAASQAAPDPSSDLTMRLESLIADPPPRLQKVRARRDDRSVVEVLLERWGFEKEEGVWRVPPEAEDQLFEIARNNLKAAGSKRARDVKKENLAEGRYDDVGASANCRNRSVVLGKRTSHEPSFLEDVLRACLPDLLNSRENPRRPLREEEVVELLKPGPDSVEDFRETPLGAALTSREQALEEGDSLPLALVASDLAARLLFERRFALERLPKIIGFDEEELYEVLQSEPLEGAAVLKRGKARRTYQLSMGFVYTFDLQDLILPTFISICPINGCLTADEAPWKPGFDWRNTISIDAGLRASTLDTANPRQSEGVVPLVGVSWNPWALLRVSTGVLFYENQITRDWNADGYFGVSADLVAAAELFGGLRSIAVPDIEAVQKKPENP